MENHSGTQLTLFQEASHVNHTVQQGNDLERQMTDTSGRKCLESFQRFNRVGLWGKTFAALLTDNGGHMLPLAIKTNEYINLLKTL